MLQIKSFFKPYRVELMAVLALIFVQAITSLLLPYFLSDIVNIGIQQQGIESEDFAKILLDYQSRGIDPAAIQRAFILKTGFKMLLVSLASAAAVILIVLIASKIAASLGRDLREALFSKITSFHHDELNRFSSASLITRSTNDVNQIQMMLVMLIRLGFFAPFMAVGGLIMALNKSPGLSWTIALSIACLLGLVALIFRLSMPQFKKIQTLTDRLTQVVRQHLKGLPVIKAFNTRAHEQKKFDRLNTELNETGLFVTKTMLLMPVLIGLIMNLSAVLIIWFGAKQIAASQLRVGDMMAFLQFSTQIIMAFIILSMIFVMLPRASVSAVRIAEILHTDPVVKEPEEAVDLKDFSGKIVFDKVSFAYEGADSNALEEISFTMEPGSKLAIVGSTGSGKTTLLNLITRFYKQSSGMIYFDETPIDRISLQSLRENLAYVPQSAQLFRGSIRDNLCMANSDLSDEQIYEALEIAQALDFVEELEDSIHAEVSQAGKNFSGGQKQRLCIARALCKNAPLILMDDSFSALDFRTDRKLREALNQNRKGSSFLIVAQRVGSIKDADQILVLEEGRIVGIGKHEDLLQTCETYREIAYSQGEKEVR